MGVAGCTGRRARQWRRHHPLSSSTFPVPRLSGSFRTRVPLRPQETPPGLLGSARSLGSPTLAGAEALRFRRAPERSPRGRQCIHEVAEHGEDGLQPALHLVAPIKSLPRKTTQGPGVQRVCGSALGALSPPPPQGCCWDLASQCCPDPGWSPPCPWSWRQGTGSLQVAPPDPRPGGRCSLSPRPQCGLSQVKPNKSWHAGRFLQLFEAGAASGCGEEEPRPGRADPSCPPASGGSGSYLLPQPPAWACLPPWSISCPGHPAPALLQ